MLYELEQAFDKEAETSDMQSECIDIFFGTDSFWMENFDLDMSKSTGSDAETDRMLTLVISNLHSDIPAHILQMLKDWKEDGF